MSLAAKTPTPTPTPNAKAEDDILDIKDFDNEIKNLTTSAKVRYLSEKSFSRKQIAEHLGLRYQHVRNVLTTPLKREIKRQREEDRIKKLNDLSYLNE